MRLAKSGTKLAGFILTLFVVFGVTAISAANAQAQWRDPYYGRDQNQDYRRNRDWRNDRRNGSYGYDQAAFNQGYQSGVSTGASDGRRGQSYNPERSHYYRNAKGYRGSQQAFREGFLRGYAEGYRQYSYNRGRNYGRRFPFPW